MSGRAGLPSVTWSLDVDADDADDAAGTQGEIVLCQGRSLDRHQGRLRPCALSAVARVRGTHGLAADLCARHARMATDRMHLVREWLLLAERERRAGAPTRLT